MPAPGERVIDHVVHGENLPLNVFRDGSVWFALYGEGYDLQAGISGWGDAPFEALRDFDLAWRKERPRP